MKTAFLFPGQGSQFAGMGKSLYDRYPEAAKIFRTADEVLGFSLSKLCFEGPEADLKLTENTQPTMVTVSVAAAAALATHGIRPNFVAGHSLGEYAALVVGGALDFGDAVQIVRKRGRYMQEAVPAGMGAMAALLRLPDGILDGILAEAAQGQVVSAAGLNSPEQTVIAGHTEAVNRAVELAKAAGCKRAVLLPVSAPFHCALMKPAQDRLAKDLEAAHFRDLSIPLVNNWQGREVHTAADVRQGLYEQVPNPVRWADTIRYMAAQGVTKFVEVGAGNVLTGMLKNIDASLSGAKFVGPEDWDKLSAYLAA